MCWSTKKYSTEDPDVARTRQTVREQRGRKNYLTGGDLRDINIFIG